MAAHCMISGSMWGWMAIRYHIDGGNLTLTVTADLRRKDLCSKVLWMDNCLRPRGNNTVMGAGYR